MTSSPLLTKVAELMVITGPMAQVGCASASAGVTFASSAFVRPGRSAGGGHDQLAHIGARAGRQCLEERRVLESTGMI